MNRMKRSLSLLAALLLCAAVKAQDSDLLEELSLTIAQAPRYDAGKQQEIASLQSRFQAGNADRARAFEHYYKVYEAYKLFHYDSAYIYAGKLVQLAQQLPDPAFTVKAQLSQSFILLSAGLYKEAFDSLSSLSQRPVPDSLKGDYYMQWGRYYYDLAGYAVDNYHSVGYDIKGNSYLDSALKYYPAGSFAALYYEGLKLFKQNKTDSAALYFDRLLARKDLSLHETALTTSTYSAIYQQRGNTDRAIELLSKASIADIRSSTKETVAIFHLAELLYKKGDLKHAALCIESGISNAEHYGARQRKLQASSILPLIEGERINGIEAQRSMLLKYSVLLTLLAFALVVLIWIVLRQVKKLKEIQAALTLANHQQQVINEKLQEANHIKEEYIGYFFDADSAFYHKIDKIKDTIEQKLQERRYEDIRFFLNKIDPRKEKHELLQSFDTIFIKLFPNFVPEVNALLRDEEQVVLKEGELLTTDLRIYALMRLGVTDPEKIAAILEYSVKTIYSYRSRLKNKSKLPPEAFEERVMQIKTV